MEVLDGTTIFWLLTLGMLAGAAVKVVMWNTTVGILPNVIAGAAGAVIVGGLTTALNLPGGLLFAFLGSLGILFILNVFNMKRESVH